MDARKLSILKSLLALTLGLIQVLLVACMSGNVKSAPGTTTTIILIRHAEKTEKGLVDGSYLIPEGRDRAQALVAKVRDMAIFKISDRGTQSVTTFRFGN